MAWYNAPDNCTRDNVFLFHDKNNNLTSSYKLISNFPSTKEIYLKKGNKLDTIINSCNKMNKSALFCFDLVNYLKEDLTDIKIGILNSQLKYPNMNSGLPFYGMCFYLSLIHEDENKRIINFSIFPGDIRIEIRYVEFFTIEDSYLTEKIMHWQLGMPSLSINKLISKATDSDFSELSSFQKSKLFTLIYDYLKTIFIHLKNGGKLKEGGVSAAEKIIYSDLKILYGIPKGFAVKHGERPIPSPKTNSLLQLDLQLSLDQVKIAIEVQGPDHYDNSFRPNNFEDVREKDHFKRVWCKDNKVTLISLSWKAYQKYVFKKSDNGRLKITKDLIDQAIALNISGQYYFEIEPEFFENR